jgi:hypothetical protein
MKQPWLFLLLCSSFLCCCLVYALEEQNDGNSYQESRSTNDDNSSCENSWPSMDFFLPVRLAPNNSRNCEWSDALLHSMKLFWPFEKLQKSRFIIVLDEELKGSDLVQDYVLKIIQENKDVIKFEVIYHHMTIPLKGYDRQQQVMFWADNFTTAEYVAFLDTDALFITSVNPHDFFENTKAIIHGRIQQYFKKNVGYPLWPTGTYHTLNEEEPMTCMSYFPVILKVSHFPEMRTHIEKVWKRPFDQAFHDMTVKTNSVYSQFKIMCAYAFWHKREEYTWHVRDLSPWWDGFHPPPVFAQWADRSVFAPGQISIKPATSVHMRYHHQHHRTKPIHLNQPSMHAILLKGICHSIDYQKHFLPQLYTQDHDFCSPYLSSLTTPYFLDMFIFESYDCTTALNETQLIALVDERKKYLQSCKVLPIALREFVRTYGSYTSLRLKQLLLEPIIET